MPVEVKVHQGEPIESALRRFKRTVEKAGILQEVKKRERYQKPSEIKHQKALERKRKIAKMTKKMKELEEKDDDFGMDEEKEDVKKQFIRQQSRQR